MGTETIHESPAETVNGDRLLVDRITYLVSLISDPLAVDPMLDTLRRITARMRPLEPLSDSDHQALSVLETRLKSYLMHDDPVRSFSEISLNENLNKYVNDKTKGYSVKRQLGIILSLTLVSYTVAILLGHHTNKSLLTMSPVALTLLNFGIAWFFWSARRDYVHEIRTMYSYFSTGVIIRSVALIQFPILLAAPQLRQHVLFHYVGFLPPFILMSMTFYFGMTLYARKLQLKTRFNSLLAVCAAAALLAVGIFLVSHPSKAASGVFFNISLVSFLMSAYFSVAAAVLAFTVARSMTSRYAQSMRLLAMSQILFAVGCLCFSAVMITVAGPLTNLEIGLSALSFVVPEVLLLLSAYNAKRTVNEIR